MAYCVKCGAKVDDGTILCPQCGAEIPNVSGRYTDSRSSGSNMNNQTGGQEYTYYGSQSYQQTGYQQGNYQQTGYQQGNYQQYGYQAQSYGSEIYFEQDEVRRNKVMGVLSYLGILVLIPLLAGDRQSQYVKHHINQGLTLFILSSLVDLLEGDWVWGIHSIIHFGGGMFSWVFDILGFAFFILMIMGIITACKGERKELPVIGKIRFFK